MSKRKKPWTENLRQAIADEADKALEAARQRAVLANDQVGTIFTISELAKRWRTSRHTVTAAIRAGRLQAFKVGERVYRIREAEVVRYEQQHLAVAS